MEERSLGIAIELYFSPAFHIVCPHLPSQVDLDPSSGTIRGLINAVSEICGEKGKTLLCDPESGCVHSALMAMVNDHIYTGNALNERDVPLCDGDRISFLHVISGG
jgi:hypothetical protein